MLQTGTWYGRNVHKMLVLIIIMLVQLMVPFYTANAQPIDPWSNHSLSVTDTTSYSATVEWEPLDSEYYYNLDFYIYVDGVVHDTVTMAVYDSEPHSYTINNLKPAHQYEVKIEASIEGQLTNTGPTTMVQTDLVSFDSDLEAAIKEKLGIEPEDPISFSDVIDVEALQLEDSELTSLEGIQNFSNLSELYLSSNSLTDEALAPLTELDQLVVLELDDNLLVNPSTLGSINTLTSLSLMKNQIEDISFVENLSNLEYLYLAYNYINDIEPLGTLPFIEEVDLYYNPIDLDPGSGSYQTLLAFLPNEEVVIYFSELAVSDMDESTVTLSWDNDDYYYNFEFEVYRDGELIEDDPTNFEMDEEGFIQYQAHIPEAGNAYEFQVKAVSDDGEVYVISTPIVIQTYLNEEVEIPDPVLEQLIRDKLSIPEVEPITTVDMLGLKQLIDDGEDNSNGKIKDLTGLEHAHLLEDLELPNHEIYDLSPLDGLLLEYLDVSNNRLSNVDIFDEAGYYTWIMDLMEYPFLNLSGNYLEVTPMGEPSEGSDLYYIGQLMGLFPDPYIIEYMNQKLDDESLYWEDQNILTASWEGPDALTLQWSEVEDAIEYMVYANNEPIGTTSETQMTVSNLEVGRTYLFKVEAVDPTNTETVSGPHVRVKPSGIIIDVQWDEGSWVSDEMPSHLYVAVKHVGVSDEYLMIGEVDENNQVFFPLTEPNTYEFHLLMDSNPEISGAIRVLQSEQLQVEMTAQSGVVTGYLKVIPLNTPASSTGEDYGIQDVMWYVENWDQYGRDFNMNGENDTDDVLILLKQIPFMVQVP